jgi:hypothetical protein
MQSWAGRMAEVVEYLSSRQEAPSSNPSTIKKKEMQYSFKTLSYHADGFKELNKKFLKSEWTYLMTS